MAPYSNIRVFEGFSESIVSESSESSSAMLMEKFLVERAKKRINFNKGEKKKNLLAVYGKKMANPRPSITEF